MTGLEAAGALLGVAGALLFIGLLVKIESAFWGNFFLWAGMISCLPLFLRLWLYVFIG